MDINMLGGMWIDMVNVGKIVGGHRSFLDDSRWIRKKCDLLHNAILQMEQAKDGITVPKQNSDHM